MKIRLILIFFWGVLCIPLVNAQSPMGEEERLHSNQRVMGALMARIKASDDDIDKRTLINEHMKMMDIYLSSLETMIANETDPSRKVKLQNMFTEAVYQSLSLIGSGPMAKDTDSINENTEKHLLQLKQRLSILQSLMKHVATANTFS